MREGEEENVKSDFVALEKLWEISSLT